MHPLCTLSISVPAWYLVISALTWCFGHLFLLHRTQVLTKPLASHIIPYHKKHFATLNPLVSKTTKILHFSPPPSLSRGPFLVQPEETAV